MSRGTYERGTYGNEPRYSRAAVGIAFQGIEAKTHDDMWRAQKAALAAKRGFDKLPPPTGRGGITLVIPRTTNHDVLQLATYWTGELENASSKVIGYSEALKTWKVATAAIDQIAKPGKPDDVYPKNNEFWRDMDIVSNQIAKDDLTPSKLTMAWESLEHGITHLPETLKTVAEKVYEGGAKAVDVVGGPLKVVLYGGLAFGGLFLLSRLTKN